VATPRRRGFSVPTGVGARQQIAASFAALQCLFGR
jgi:hypothetical protein